MPRLARLRLKASLVAVVSAGSVVLAGCSSSPSRPSASARATTSTSATAAPSTTTTAPGVETAPATAVALAVTPCATIKAIPLPAKALPATETVSVPADEASYLVVFSDPAGVIELVGPRGWICKATYGADGSGAMLLQPADGSLTPASGSGGHVPMSSPAEAIEAVEAGGSPVAAATLACPVVPAAAAALQRDLGKRCAARPAGETVLPASANDVAFYDPPGTAGTGIPSGGTDAASGVALYLPGGSKAKGYLATCTLPALQSAVCSTALHYFVSLYG